MSGSSNNVLPIVLGVIIALLLGLNAWLLTSKAKQSKVIVQQEQKLTQAEEMQQELQTQYDEAIAQLDQISAENEDLRASIEEQKQKLGSELRRAKAKIRELTSSGKATEEELAQARLAISEFTTQRDSSMGQIETLKAENETLKASNSQLEEAKVALEGTVEEKEEENKALEEAKEELEEKNEKKDKTIKLGSMLSIHSLKGVGVMEKKKGDIETTIAKKSDKMKICFVVAENKIAKMGQEILYLKIVNPQGETLAIESEGSGFIEDSKTGEEIRYTNSETIDYDKLSQNVCMEWKEPDGLERGNYKAEVFWDANLIGSGEFLLK